MVGVLSRSEIAIYVNGVKEGSKPLSSFTDSHSAHMRIGSSAEGGGYAYFNGVIDEVTFHQRALNGRAIKALCAEKNGEVPCHSENTEYAASVPTRQGNGARYSEG